MLGRHRFLPSLYLLPQNKHTYPSLTVVVHTPPQPRTRSVRSLRGGHTHTPYMAQTKYTNGLHLCYLPTVLVSHSDLAHAACSLQG